MAFDRFGDERIDARNNLRRTASVQRHRAQRVLDTLLCEFILRIEIQRGTELSHGLYLAAIEQGAVSAFEVHPSQMLPRDFVRRDVFNVLRNEAGGFLKFQKSFFQILSVVGGVLRRFLSLRFLELKSASKCLTSRLQVFGRSLARGSAPGVRAQRWRTHWSGVGSQTHSGKQQDKSR
jgi:hypothetical protein